MKGKHKHHIIPRHAGGSNDPDNSVYLTVEEHAEAHKKLYEKCRVGCKRLAIDFDRKKLANNMLFEIQQTAAFDLYNIVTTIDSLMSQI